ncbi:hypothetical protein ACFQ1I_25205 [Kitasatospora arboriphila]
MLVTSRPLDEYCASFGLSRAVLRGLSGPLLDCPGGAAGLAAEARALGCQVVAADPLYAVPPAVLADLARAGRDAMAAQMCSTPQRYPSPATSGTTSTCAAGTGPGSCSRPTGPPTPTATWPPNCPGCRSPTAPSPSPSARTCCSPTRTGSAPTNSCRRCSNWSG